MPRFVPRQRKHKVRARESKVQEPQTDSNLAQIPSISQAEKEERRKKLRAELRAQQGPVSSKKQKRLNKYIENKLKKDETLDYLRKLEREKEKHDSKTLQTSKYLGKRTFGEFVSGSGLGISNGASTHVKQDAHNYGESDSDHSEDSFEAERKDALDTKENVEDEPVETTRIVLLSQQGSGLAKPLVLGEDGLPIIQQRPRKKKKLKKAEAMLPTPSELSWEGFDSEGGEMPDLDSDRETRDSDLSEGEDSESEDEDDEGEGSTDERDQRSDGNSSSTQLSTEEVATQPRKSAFKAWATQQLNQSLGHVPSYEAGPAQLPPKPASTIIPSKQDSPSLAAKELQLPNSDRKAYAVHVQRREDIQALRSKLPVLQREQEIMEAIHNNPVVVIKGDTGSGKTTQIPQLLYESGYGSPDGPTPGMIGITQPRRVAAVSMAKRVAEELGNDGERVSYQIRFDSNTTPKTAIKFMTDGILLRELSQDLLLKKYSAIVIDEAHERSVNTDLLIGILCKIVPARMKKSHFNPDPTPLKLIIMSATLNVGDFLNDRLFSPDCKPPIVEAEGRQHRVTTHFALRSRSDYVEEVVEKVKRAHSKLPKGGILVFLTGQNEIRQVNDRLRKLLAVREKEAGPSEMTRIQIAASEVPLEIEDMDFEIYKQQDDHDDFDVDILTHSEDEAEAEEFEVSEDENEEPPKQCQTVLPDSKNPYSSVHILPLYSQLPTKEQLRVFEEPPSGARLIILATNVAETSLTIPGIRYVFDTGRSKERRYDLDTGVQSFAVDYISKASASQRAGRAGRTGPGHCWRLYTSAVYEQFFPDHAEPEIVRAPVESVVLQLKGVGYPKPITEFPFPTLPASSALLKADRLLKNLGALTDSGSVTNLGKQLSIFPLAPRLGKILAYGIKDASLLLPVISLVAGMSVSEVFINESQIDMTPHGRQESETYTHEDQQEDEVREKRKQEHGRAKATLSRQDKTSDVIKLLTAVLMYTTSTDKEQFCKDYFLRSKAMMEVVQLQRQLLGIVKANNPLLSDASKQDSKLSSKQIRQLNTVAASGYIDQVAIRADLSPNPPVMSHKPRRAIDVPYLPLISLSDRASAVLATKAIFIHPSSLLARQPHKDLPQYIVYSHLQKSQAHTIGGEGSQKTRMFPLTPIDGPHLVELGKDTTLLEYGKPVPKTKVEDVAGTPKRRECWVVTELRGGGAGSYGWPMPPLRVRQVMDVKSSTGWRVEQVLS